MRSLIFVSLLLVVLCACESTSDPAPEIIPEPPEEITVSFTGKANKGPFLTGSEVTIVELDSNLNPTGSTYFTEILNNDGSYEVKGIKLKSDFIEVRVNGFFYDEAMRTVTDNKLSLSSVVKITDGAVSNVNILTHLERKRVATLMSTEDFTYDQAKDQAFQELMVVLGFDVSQEYTSESMDLLIEADDSEILLAASSIISAAVPWKVGEEFALWNSFLVSFASDFGDNGVIDNQKLKSRLYESAYYVKNNIDRIKQGLTNKFSQEFFEIEIPDFEKYIDQSLESSDYAGALDNLLERLFPDKFEGAINVLSLPENTVLHPDSSYVIYVEPQPTDINYLLMLEVYASAYFDSSSNMASDAWASYNTDEGAEIGSLQITNNTNERIIIPVTFTGTGNLNLAIDLNIHHVISVQNRTFQW